MSERHVTVDIIIAAVSAVTGVHRMDILADFRHPEIVRARDTTIWLASKMLPLTVSALGRILGDRDPSSINHGLRRAEELRATDREYRVDTDAMLGTLLAIEQQGLLRLAQIIDPIALARRVIANPARESVRVSSHEIIALCQLVLETFDTSSTPSPDTENSDAA